MKTWSILSLACVALVPAVAGAQPMSGVYTVGGASPDFATVQLAADALMARGVSGHVFVRLRPGLHMPAGGATRVLNLSAPVPGTSPAARIVFEPDAASGASVANVTLAVDLSAQSFTPLAFVVADHVSFQRLTFADRDSGQAGSICLLHFEGHVQNPTLEGIEVLACRFVGNPTRTSSGGLGTDFGIHAYGGDARDVVVRGCTFRRLRRPLEVGTEEGGVPGDVTVENCVVTETFTGVTGTGNPLGHGIHLIGERVVARRNVCDFTGAASNAGVHVRARDYARVEKNLVRGGGGGGPGPFRGIVVDDWVFESDSALVANNMIMAAGASQNFAMRISARGARVAHNTVVHRGGSTYTVGMELDAPDLQVFDNIVDVQGPGFRVAFEVTLHAAATLQSDANVLTVSPGAALVRLEGTPYTSLPPYRADTGRELQSSTEEVSFVHPLENLHLTECAGQDPRLRGIAIAGIDDDFDFDRRPADGPTIGADQARTTVVPLFAGPFRLGLPGTPFAVTAGAFDPPSALGLAIPDYDGDQVHLFHNAGAGRSFTPAASLPVPFAPVSARFTDFDRDGASDLIVGGEAAGVVVYWGDGAGGFADSTHVPTLGRVVSIEPEPSPRFAGVDLVYLAEDNGFVPTTSWLGVLVHLGNREVCADVLRQGSASDPDTVFATLHDLVVADLGGPAGYEIAGIGLGPGPSGQLATFAGLISPFVVGQVPCPNMTFEAASALQPQPIASYGGHGSSLAAGDFDGDGDRDLVSTGFTSHQLVLLRNDGALGFSAEPVAVNDALALVALDYEDDGDLDVVTVNRTLEQNGVTLFTNDGAGAFTSTFNCFQGFGSGVPFAATAADFDLDGRTDVAIVTSFDSLFVLYNAAGTIVADAGAGRGALSGVRLAPCAPNPLRGEGRLRFVLPAAGHVRLTLHDVGGRRVASLIDGPRAAGAHDVAFDAARLEPGVYHARLDAAGARLSRKVVVLR